jgi:hypothetical protein
LIDQAIQFKRKTDGDITSFTWIDVSEVRIFRDLREQWQLTNGVVFLAKLNQSNEVFEFVCDKSVQSYSIETFESAVYDCMYERKSQRSRDEATDEDIAAIKQA